MVLRYLDSDWNSAGTAACYGRCGAAENFPFFTTRTPSFKISKGNLLPIYTERRLMTSGMWAGDELVEKPPGTATTLDSCGKQVGPGAAFKRSC